MKPQFYFVKLQLITTLALVLGLFLSTYAETYTIPTTDRKKTDLSSNIWKFTKSNTLTSAEGITYNDATWSTVTIPHTFTTKTDRTAFSNSWYRTHFTSSPSDTLNGERIYLFFECANENADVYLNGTLLGSHKGGYTAFIFDATKERKDGDNVLAVKVDNLNHNGLPANGNGWLGYGGLTRKVWIVKTNKYAVDPTDFASSGVYISQTAITATNAALSVKTMLKNSDTQTKLFTVKTIICDNANTIIKTISADISVSADSNASVLEATSIVNPKLWTIGNPYLYNFYTEIWVDNKLKDVVFERTGFRYYTLTTTNFTMNGVQKLLRGACLHEIDEKQGGALDSFTIFKQLDVARDLGMNFIRLAHYAHSQAVYNLADEFGLGLITETGLMQNSVDIGNGDRDNNCRELVKQNYNHPSVLFWCAGNEDYYNANITRFANVLKATDSTRKVFYASSGQNPSGCDFISSNLYQGWYSGTIQDFPAGKPWVSESGAGGSVATHQDYRSLVWTVGSFEPEEYESLVNEYKYEYIFTSNPTKVPFYTHWLLFDTFGGTYKGVNSKGMCTGGGMPKDCALLWKIKAKPSSPRVYINGKHWYLRNNVSSVKVYSNQPSITLFVNGTNKGTKADGAYTHPSGGSVIHDVFLFDSVLQKGKNIVVATNGTTTADTAIIYYTGTAATASVDNTEYITTLTSSNTNNPAYFVNIPIHEQWPIYYQADGAAENSFDTIPAILQNARWIATKRQSAQGATTNLSFTINSSMKNGVDVFIMCTRQATAPSWISSTGFTDTKVTGLWRDNAMNLVEYQLFKKTVVAGTPITIGSSSIDFIVLIKDNTQVVVDKIANCSFSPKSKKRVFKIITTTLSVSTELFLEAKNVDIFDLSGRCIQKGLDKIEYDRFCTKIRNTQKVFMVRTALQ